MSLQIVSDCSTIKYDSITFELATSMNFDHCVTPYTKIIIVGTITPPAGNGYFYTAPRNKIYGYIDAAKNTNLKELKNLLKANTSAANNTKLINDIKGILTEQNIAFLDVFKEVIRKKTSCYDKDIIYATLDYDTFNKAFSRLNINDENDVKVICNSQLANQYYDQIKANLISKGKITLPNSILLSQRWGKKSEWQDALQ